MSKLLSLISILSMSLVNSNSYAFDLCYTLKECEQLRQQVDEKIQQIQIESIQSLFGNVVKKDLISEKYCSENQDRDMCLMGRYQATAYCASQGMRLPSAREYALLAMSMGATGISETILDTHSLISARNDNNKVDSFYYNKAGYLQPEGLIGKNSFWTSLNLDPGIMRFSYIFNGQTGNFGQYLAPTPGTTNNGTALVVIAEDILVRCIAN